VPLPQTPTQTHQKGQKGIHVIEEHDDEDAEHDRDENETENEKVDELGVRVRVSPSSSDGDCDGDGVPATPIDGVAVPQASSEVGDTKGTKTMPVTVEALDIDMWAELY